MTMTFTTEAPVAILSYAMDTPARAAQAMRTLFARWTDRRTLAGLLELEPSRLDDLGIDISDVRQALRGNNPGSHLERRRYARSLAAAAGERA